MQPAAIAIALFASVPSALLADILEIQPVTDRVWAIVGPLEQRNPENLGNNATFGLVVTDSGAVLVDPGGSWAGAALLHDTIRQITDAPVTHVINTGGQDHRWLGNGYWQAQGAVVIASEAAVADQAARGSMQMTGLSMLIGPGLDGTDPSHADITFQTDYRLETGGQVFEIMHRGQGHTPGDAFVWLESAGTMFTGDLVYVERILGNADMSNAGSWIAAFDDMAAFAPRHVVPGHGHATDLATARRDTRDYLQNLRDQIGALLDAGGTILDAPGIDQSGWAYLAEFDSLAGRNAQAAFEQMEWE